MIKTKYRYERKFFISNLDNEQLQLILKLHPANFKEIYHRRQINNIYFDTYDHAHYLANLDGQNNRLKIRVRWYEDLKEARDPQLEFKIKVGLINKKSTCLVKPFVINKVIPSIEVINPNPQDQELLGFNNLQAVLINNYQRQYFQSFDAQYRITIDQKLDFYPVSSSRDISWSKKFNVPGTILELKYDVDAEDGADKISNFFPFRLSRSSKYIMGMKNLYPNILK